MTVSSLRNLVCARCGTAFTCGAGSADGRCWCAEESIRVPMPASPDADCLCPACLRTYADQLRPDQRP